MIPYYGPEVSTDITFMRTYKSRTGHRVKIPKEILKKVMEGNKNRNYLTLTCAVTPGKLWAADIVGRKISFGWETFAKENSFVDGDLLLFKYNGRTRFHVERFHSIGYTPEAAARGNERRNRTNSTNTQEVAATGNFRRNITTSANTQEAYHTDNEGRFTTLTITADKIENSRMYLPKIFCTVNGLHKFAGKEIAMLGEDGTPFAVKLKTQSFLLRRRLQLQKGLRDFFEENDIHPNDQLTFELLQDNMSVPKLKLHSKVVLVPN